MKDIIWYEMVHVKYGVNYLACYLDRQKFIKKWYKILILIFSASGVFGWKVWTFIPVIACGLIAIMQIVTLIEKHVIPTDKDIEDVSKLRNKYITYFNKLEKLWKDYRSKQLDEKQARDQFYTLREFATTIESLDNKLNIRDFKKQKAKANKQTNDYFSQYHS